VSETKKYSVSIRLICGILGVLGIATLIFNFSNTGEIEISILSLASAFALFIFLFVAIKGTNPLESIRGKEE
jgi:hypothetical protein